MDIDFLLSFVAISTLMLLIMYSLGILSDERAKLRSSIDSLKKRRGELYEKRLERIKEAKLQERQDKYNKLGENLF